MLSVMGAIPVSLVLIVLLCWLFLSLIKHTLMLAVVGIQFTLLGMFLLLLAHVTSSGSELFVYMATVLAVFGTILTIVSSIKSKA